MYKNLSKDEIEKNRAESFEKLDKWSMFDVWRERFFLVDDKRWKTLIVIELTKENIDLILVWKSPDRSELNINEMTWINIDV